MHRKHDTISLPWRLHFIIEGVKTKSNLILVRTGTCPSVELGLQKQEIVTRQSFWLKDALFSYHQLDTGPINGMAWQAWPHLLMSVRRLQSDYLQL